MNDKLSRKLRLMRRLQDELHDFVWDICAKYQKLHNTRERLDTWKVSDGEVCFEGSYYGDWYYLDIPLKWFEDFDACAAEFLAEQKEKKRIEEEKREQARIAAAQEQEIAERKKYEELRQKYEQRA